MEAKVTKTLTLVLSESDCKELRNQLVEIDELWNLEAAELKEYYKGSTLGKLWEHLNTF
jgi:ABC-type polysaccharide/polyol phosphate export permease